MRTAAFIFLAFFLVAAPARAATDWVLILDNSASMAHGSDVLDPSGKLIGKIPAQDPDRMAIIATQIFRSMLDPADKITILVFDHSRPGISRTLPATQPDVRGLQFTEPTFFVGPMKDARRILDGSQAANKILLILTDGAPSPEAGKVLDANGARQLLGLDRDPVPFQVVSLGLTNHPDTRTMQDLFLRPLGRLETIDSPSKLVAAFTSVFAENIRSRPESGRLQPGATHAFRVPRYVTEVLVAAATEQKTGPFEMALTADGKPVKPLEGGDSGCRNPPCHAYQVFKVPHDPDRAAPYSLRLVRSAGPVAFGLILRYDLGAEIVSAPARGRVGEELDVVARMTWRGKVFNDPAFFGADGFTATLAVGEITTPLARREDGTFTAKIRIGGQPGTQALEARFTNQWLKLTAERPVAVTEWLPLSLVVGPLDFGSWTGERTASRRCVDVDLSRSKNADRVALEALAEGLPPGFRLDVPTPLVVSGNRTQVCLEAPGCCEDATAAGATVVLRGQDPHYHPGAARVPASFRVAETPFIVCWWRVIAAVTGGLLMIFIINGIVRPRDFDREEVIRLAKTEQALARASGRRLRDLPGGRRGFYRDARVAFDSAGNPVSPKHATLVLQAGKTDALVVRPSTIEERDPRTRKFQPVDLSQGPSYLRRGVVYRSGDFFVRLG